MLLQIQAGDTCYIVDALTAQGGVMKSLKALLEDKTVVKVIHDCRQDSAALYYQKGIKLENVFDTQVQSETSDYTISTASDTITACTCYSRNYFLCMLIVQLHVSHHHPAFSQC